MSDTNGTKKTGGATDDFDAKEAERRARAADRRQTPLDRRAGERVVEDPYPRRTNADRRQD